MEPGKCPSCLPSVGGYASNTSFIMIIPGNFLTIPGYSENLPDYSRIFPDSFNHLLCSKLCQHNRRMPKDRLLTLFITPLASC